jgi:hypothetical protein
VGRGTSVGIAGWWPRSDPVVDRETLGYADRVDATVTAAEVGPCSYDPGTECNSVSARIASGPDERTFATLEADVGTRTQVSKLAVGDDIVLNDAGPDVDAARRYSFADVQRRMSLDILALIFAVAGGGAGAAAGVAGAGWHRHHRGGSARVRVPGVAAGLVAGGGGPHRRHHHRRQNHLSDPRRPVVAGATWSRPGFGPG